MMIKADYCKEITLMAIDPGLNNIGVAIYFISLNPNRINKIIAFTLKATKVVDSSGLDEELLSEQFIKRQKMTNAVKQIAEQYMPDIFVSESPFFNHKTPGSFAILTEVISSCFDKVIEIDPNTVIATLEPKYVKKLFGIAKEIGKEVVKDAVSRFTIITDSLEGNLEALDEHSVDAIAIGYTYLVNKAELVFEEHRNAWTTDAR